ncbi:MAG TPA: hypothetical protein ACFCUD_12450 [Cyclobacteriaceae bacterium]
MRKAFIYNPGKHIKTISCFDNMLSDEELWPGFNLKPEMLSI